MPMSVVQQLSQSIYAGYDSDTQELIVQFPNGMSYTYSGVPPDIYEGLAKSSSPGKYFNTRIRGVY